MNRLASLIAVPALLVACGNNAHGPAQTPAPSTAGATAPSNFSSESAKAADSYSPPPAPASPSPAGAGASRATAAESDAMQPRAEERPGLGTQWGETRSSRVSSTSFERNDPTRPAAIATLFYNDADGVRAQTRDGSLSMAPSDGVAIAGGALSVRLLDASGRPLPTYQLGARSYVVGSDGDRYSLQIQNHTGGRVEAVATVDGLDVIDGHPGAFEKRGYLVAPWATVEIDGFRQSMDQVAAFRFGSVANSYAAKKGDDRNVGVIGVAFFGERGQPFPWNEREIQRRNGADAFPGRFATPPQ